MPALITLMLGTIQAGLLAFSYNMMVGAARDAARSLALCSVDVGGAEAQAAQNLPPWVPAASWTITADNGGPDATVTISVPSATAMILNYVPFDLPTLTASVTVMQEPNGYGSGHC